MTIFIFGLVVFFGIHLVPITPIKPLLINRIGEGLYSGLFSLLALFGLIVIIYGFRTANTDPLWNPLPYSRELAIVLMPIAVIFLMPGSGKTNYFQKFKHPMFMGILTGLLCIYLLTEICDQPSYFHLLPFIVLSIRCLRKKLLIHRMPPTR